MRQATHIVSILLFLGATICQGEDRVFLDDFLDSYCFECHDDLLEKGGVNLMDLAFNPSDVENSKQWTRVFEKIEAETMPPPDEKILPNTKERERVLATLLDRTMVLHGSNLGDAARHDGDNLPILLAGGGFKHGQSLAYDRKHNRPPAELFVSMLQRLEIETERFSSGTKPLPGLEMV